MQIGRVREMRQPGRMSSGFGMEGQRLVFLYPMLCDQGLQRMLNDFRDFLTVSYIGEIKISNALNITSDSYRNIGAIGSGSRAINPAQMVRQAIWAGPDLDPGGRTQTDQWTSQENRALYQDKINQFNHFLRNQIQHDPRYSKLRPVVSSITVENLVNIPLIVGTQAYQIEPEYLYMVLLTSIIYGIPLNKKENLKRIFSLIDVMDKNTIMLSISDPQRRAKMERLIGYDSNNPRNSNVQTKFDRVKSLNQPRNPGALQKRIDKFRGKSNEYQLNPTNTRKLVGWLNNERTKAEVFFDLVLDLNRWTAVNSNLETRQNLNINRLSIPSPIQNKHYDRAVSSFQQYVENCIIPIFHSIDILVGPTIAGTSLSAKIEQFLTDIFDNLNDHYEAISQMIVGEIQDQYSGDDAMTSHLNRIVDLCKQNSEISITTRSALDNLDNYIHLPPTMTGHDINQFISTLKTTADQLDAKQRILDEWLKALTKSTAGAQLVNRVQGVITQFKSTLHRMFFSHYPTGHASGHQWIDPQIRDPYRFANRYTNYAIGVLGFDPEDSLDITNKKISRKEMQNFDKYIVDIQLSIEKILMFFFKWNFFSYTCSYMNDVEIDVEIQRRDALEFPNYCLVLPFSLFQGLYITRVIRNFESLIKQKKVNNALNNIDTRDVIPNMSDVNRLINMVNQQLKIPNIILVDEKTKTCYYKFMYMTKPVRVSLSAMKSYIKHQKDVLPGF